MFNDVKARIFKVKQLPNKNTLELLKLNSESISTHEHELTELFTADPTLHASLKSNMFDHELFSFLNGHPLSVVILSSLRKNMSLLEIFELLKMIKDNYTGEEIDQATLSLMLSVEASLIFVRKENKLAYEALLVYSLSPSGYLRSHLLEMFGEKWPR